MAYYLMSPDGKPTAVAPSLLGAKKTTPMTTNGCAVPTNGTNGRDGDDHAVVPEHGNPTVVPLATLGRFHFAFLIRHPRRAIPSYYRCCVPPQSAVTGFDGYMPNEAGYAELVRLFDFLCERKVVGPAVAGRGGDDDNDDDDDDDDEDEAQRQGQGQISITVVDADDLLDRPREVIEAFCRETGVDYTPDMLSWDDPEDQRYATGVFAKWNGFHNDAINSTRLSARTTAHVSCYYYS